MRDRSVQLLFLERLAWTCWLCGLPGMGLGAFAARNALPTENGVLAAQQLQTCPTSFKAKNLLVQENSTLCNSTKIHNSSPPSFPMVPRNFSDI